MQTRIHTFTAISLLLVLLLGSNGLSSSRAAASEDGTVKWSFPSGSINAMYDCPAVGADGTIYTATGGKVYAIKPDGTQKWVFPNSGFSSFSPPTIGRDGTVYVGCSDRKLYAIKTDGSQKWAYQFPLNLYDVYPIALAKDGTIYVGSSGGDLYALTPDGSEKWVFHFDYPYHNYPVNRAAAIGRDGTIYVLWNYGAFLTAINPDGTQKWALSLGGNYGGQSPAIGSDGTVFVAPTESTNLFAFTPEGSQKWVFNTMDGDMVTSSPVIGGDGTIYLGTHQRFYALRPDGGMKWLSPKKIGYRTPSIGRDGTIFIVSLYLNEEMNESLPQLVAMNADATQKWTVSLPDPARDGMSSPTIGLDGTVYVIAGPDLYAIKSTCGGLAKSPWPMYRHDPKLTGRAESCPSLIAINLLLQ